MEDLLGQRPRQESISIVLHNRSHPQSIAAEPRRAGKPYPYSPNRGRGCVFEIRALCRIAQSKALRFGAADGREPQICALRKPA
jgi:hypothetical protein